MREKIQALISKGQTEEALELLAQLTQEAVLLQNRFSTGKKQYGMGLIDFSEWSRAQAQINYAAMEIVKNQQGGGISDTTPGQVSESPLPPNFNTTRQQPTVFLIYDQDGEEDVVAANRIREYLTANRVRVTTTDDIPFGAEIKTSVTNAIKTSDLALVVISSQSLRASWDNEETPINIVLDRIGENYVIPVSLDKSVLDPDFYFESLDLLNEKIKKWREHVQKAITRGDDSRGLQVELNRLELAKSQLSPIIEKMKSVRMVSIGRSTGNSQRDFEQGMGRILQRLTTSQN